jgi:hypothetical protein
MAWEMREGQGSVFPNKLRDKETQPNARGECLGERHQCGRRSKATRAEESARKVR